jgi:hypothetical protein
MTNHDWCLRVRSNGFCTEYVLRSASLVCVGSVCVAVAQRAGVFVASILPDTWNRCARGSAGLFPLSGAPCPERPTGKGKSLAKNLCDLAFLEACLAFTSVCHSGLTAEIVLGQEGNCYYFGLQDEPLESATER